MQHSHGPYSDDVASCGRQRGAVAVPLAISREHTIIDPRTVSYSLVRTCVDDNRDALTFGDDNRDALTFGERVHQHQSHSVPRAAIRIVNHGGSHNSGERGAQRSCASHHA